MTFAPPKILEVRAYLKGEDADLDNNELGIVGGPSHVLEGTSYHLGADQLKFYKDPYSYRTARDKAGLSNAASALDVDDDLDELRQLSIWMVQQCRAGAADTLDFREIIYSPDGVVVLRWDRERGVTSEPYIYNAPSHRTHSHFAWFRDSEFRDKLAPFKRFFEGGDVLTPQDIDAIWAHVPNHPPDQSNPLQYPISQIEIGTNQGVYKTLGGVDELRMQLMSVQAKLDQLLAVPPGSPDPEAIRAVVRQELDRTKLAQDV